jgi:nicotinamidase-related amidase
MTHAALLIVDVQKFGCSPDGGESQTADGRDRSLDYKITGCHVPKGSPRIARVDVPRGCRWRP